MHCRIEMEDLSLHILDIVENSIRAKAKKIIISILEDQSKDELALCIEDDGEGMDKQTVERVIDPFFTTKKEKKVGLGLALLNQAVKETGGRLNIDSRYKATRVTAIFKSSHPDMRPIGDVLETIGTLVATNPSIQFIYDYKKGDYHYHFDSYRLGPLSNKQGDD